MAHRHYDLEIPYHVPTMFLGMAISRMEAAGYWDDLPIELQRKLKNGQSGWNGVDLTQEDLDSIPDVLWYKIALTLNISWQTL